MKKMLLIMLALTWASLALPAAAIELGGDAPPLAVKEWVKGKQLSLAEGKGKKIYVVEFWATWCGPCRTSIPHLTELQKKYADKDVVVIGISDEEPATVKPFVTEMGDKMNYTVAADADKKTNKAYLGAFGVDSIPHAFIVNKEGKLVWHGHPMDGMDGVLELLVAGKFDMAAVKNLEQAKLRRAAQENLLKAYLFMIKMTDERDLAQAVGNRIMERAKDDAEMLNNLAWAIAGDEELKDADLALAERAAKQANALSEGKNASVLDTYAVVQFKTGKKQEAIATEKKAIAVCTETDMKDELQKRLKQFEQAATK